MNVRCKNCQEFSHKVQNCPQPRKKILCFMCGDEGHKEPRCPNKMCLTCGAPTKVFMRNCQKCNRDVLNRCTLCNCKGHPYYRCPDKWRRYHNTVSCFHKCFHFFFLSLSLLHNEGKFYYGLTTP